jgi:fermentation-respiration switch protein FrsA (DUF1100 family)
VQRSELQFPSRAESCAATLHRPDGDEHVPCIVMAHGFSSTRSERLDAYGERFAAAGYAALVFDYRHFGDSGGQPRQLVHIGHQLEDYRAAVEFARSLEAVDPDRIVLWGTSFSGGHVLKLAAEDHTIAATIAQTPFTGGAAAMKEIDFKTVLRGTAYGVADLAGSLFGREPILVPAVGPPGTFAVMTEPGAAQGQQDLVGENSRWRNEVAARIALTGGTYRPAAQAHRIARPLLVCVATADQTTPPEPALKVVQRAPRGELREYACGHFDIYDGEWFEQMVADEIEFLGRRLG